MDHIKRFDMNLPPEGKNDGQDSYDRLTEEVESLLGKGLGKRNGEEKRRRGRIRGLIYFIHDDAEQKAG